MNTFSINKIRPEELKTIGHYTGYICLVLGVFMVIPALCAIAFHDAPRYFHAFLISAIINIVLGIILFTTYRTRNITTLSLKGSLLFVMTIWGITALFTALPYYISGDLGILDSFFEAMSGITTTGFTMYPLTTFPYSISVWKCLTQWFGGLGIILFLLVVAPSSVSLKRLYLAEGKTEQITPNIRHTASIFIKIYLILTSIGVILYLFTGLDLFDSVCYSLTAIATGGYSVHPENLDNFKDPLIQLVTMIIMLMGGTNFVIHYRIMKRNWKNIHKDIEIRAMLIIILVTTIIISIGLYTNGLYNGDYILILRHSLFQSVSTITSTGFISTDVNFWPPLCSHILILLMFTGCSICSTSGGIKLYNIAILFKSIWWETQKMFLPKHTVIKRKIYHDQKYREISQDTIRTVLVYVMAYILIFIISTMIILMFSNNFEVAYTLAAASLGNTGVGPAYINVTIPVVVKIILIIDFWVGRIGVWPLLLSIVYISSMTQSKLDNINDD